MTRLLTLSGKTYKAIEFDTNFVCDLEDTGISLDDIDKKMLSVIRMYVACCAGCDKRTAGKMISDHIDNGGNLDDIIAVFEEVTDESGFFRQKQAAQEETSQTRTRKKKQESEEVTSKA